MSIRQYSVKMNWSEPSGFDSADFCLEFMRFTEEQYQQVVPYWPAQKVDGKKTPNFPRLNALLSRTENACQ